MDNIKLLTLILVVILGIMFTLLLVLAVVYMSSKMKRESISDENKTLNKTSGTRKYKEYKTESIMNFLEFDTVVDNMISQKNGTRYIMVVECQGINYDLMSEIEKNAVEEGFLQFLNTIRHPIQIYTQTRTINLGNSILTYKNKVDEIENEYEKHELRYKEMLRSGNYSDEELNKAYFELTKKKNLYDYGKDIIYNTEKMSLNKNVLNKKYYVIIPYFVEELGENNFDKLEQRNLAFSELYTRAQSIVRTLGVCGVNSKVMNSHELVELLYMAYNRDEAEIYGIDKALKAGYDELYTTAPDVVDKQMEELDRQIEREAIEVAKTKVNEAISEKQKKLKEKKERKPDLIAELAELIIEENAQTIGEDVAKAAKAKVKKKDKKEGGKETNEEQKTTKRVRKTKTA